MPPKRGQYPHVKSRFFKKHVKPASYHDTHHAIMNLTDQELDLLDEIVQSRARGRKGILHPVYPPIPNAHGDLSVEDAQDLAPHTHSKIALSRKHKALVLKGGGAKVDAIIKVGKVVGNAIVAGAKAVLKGTMKAAEFVLAHHKEIDAFITTGLTTAQAIQAMSQGAPPPPAPEIKRDEAQEAAASKALEDSSDEEAGASQLPGGASQLLGGASLLPGGSSQLPGGASQLLGGTFTLPGGASRTMRSKRVLQNTNTRFMI